MNAWSVWWRADNGALQLKGFADFGSAVNFIGSLGNAFVALAAPNTAGLVHIWKPLEDNTYGPN